MSGACSALKIKLSARASWRIPFQDGLVLRESKKIGKCNSKSAVTGWRIIPAYPGNQDKPEESSEGLQRYSQFACLVGVNSLGYRQAGRLWAKAGGSHWTPSRRVSVFLRCIWGRRIIASANWEMSEPTSDSFFIGGP